MLLDKVPSDGSREHGLQIGIGFGGALLRTVKTLTMNGFQARQELEPEEMAKSKSDFALPVRVDVVLFNRHFRVVVEEAVNHGGYLRGRWPLELGIDAG